LSRQRTQPGSSQGACLMLIEALRRKCAPGGFQPLLREPAGAVRLVFASPLSIAREVSADLYFEKHVRKLCARLPVGAGLRAWGTPAAAALAPAKLHRCAPAEVALPEDSRQQPHPASRD